MSDSTQCPALSDPNMQWPYCPSASAAIVVTTLFSILTFAHLLQAIIYRKKFCWVICMATSWETIGFALRLMGAKKPLIQSYAVISNILVLLAPLWVNAFAYMVMGRMVYYWLQHKRVWTIKARTLTAWFVWLDVITFFTQATGGSMMDNNDPQSAQIGLRIYMGGIGLQQAFLIIFVLLIIRFHIDVLQAGRDRPTSWQPQLYAQYIALSLITTRIIFRLIQFSSGTNGAIATKESYFYGLEATPMVLVIGVFAIAHPGRTLTGSESEFSEEIIKRGHRRWWCCGRRSRTKTDPDFETCDLDDLSGAPTRTSSGHKTKRKSERGYYSRRYSNSRWSDTQNLWDPVPTQFYNLSEQRGLVPKIYPR